MAKVYKTTDRITVKINDITVKLAPLNRDQKNEISDLMIQGQKKSDITTLNKSMLLAVSMCVKDISGLTNSDDTPYVLEFEDGKITDDCMNDLMNMEESLNLIKVCSEFVNQIPKKFEIEGVEIINVGKKT